MSMNTSILLRNAVVLSAIGMFSIANVQGAKPAAIVPVQQDAASVELHTFPTGGHGYGLRPSAYPVSGWKDLCRDWLLRQ